MSNTAYNSDYRLQWLLKKGDIIEGNGEKYIISGDPIGFGGSSVLYPASQEGSLLEYCIKECFPRRPEKYARINGIVSPEDPEDEIALAQLDTYRKMLENEQIMGQKIRNTSTRAIGIWKTLKPVSVTTEGTVYTDVGAGIFSVLERMDRKGMFFNELLAEISRNTPKERFRKTRGLPDVYTTACIMEQALLALDRVHKADCIFGDIQGANVFFSECDIDSGTVGIGHLIDFGSARKLEKDGLTVPIADGSVFSTDGFRPPEICANSDKPLKLGKQADVYSAGCLMLRCLVSPRKIDMYGDSPVAGKDTLDEPDGKAIGCSGRTLQTVNAILEKATHQNPDSRYADAWEMHEDILKLKKATAPPAYLLPPAPCSSDSYVEHSRDDSIKLFQRSLKKTNPVFIWGYGGIGKSEIAIKLAQQWDGTRGSYFVHYTVPSDNNSEAMEETVLSMSLEGFIYEPERAGMSPAEHRKAEYQKRLNILKTEYKNALIIIDNFDRPGKTLDDLRSEKSYKDVISLGIHVVFTTRNTVEWAPEWEVKELPYPVLLKLMRIWCPDPLVTDDQLLTLIEAVNGHTLTVDLMAKTLSKSRRKVSPEQMLECLASRMLDETQYPKVRNDQNRNIKTAQIYDHLKALFDLSGADDAAKCILCHATLLPNAGIDCQIFESCLRENSEDELSLLIDCGWLKLSERNVLSIHPVIRGVCKNELANIGRAENIRFFHALLEQTDKLRQCKGSAATREINQIIPMCDGVAARIGSTHIPESLQKHFNNLLETIGKYHLYKLSKSLFPLGGLTQIPYSQKNRKTRIYSFDLDESDNIRYAVCMVEKSDASGFIMKALESKTVFCGTHVHRIISFSLDHMMKSFCLYALHNDTSRMYRYNGYFSPTGVMLNPRPHKLSPVFIDSRKAMVRVSGFENDEIPEDILDGRTIEEADTKETPRGKTVLINPDNMQNIVLFGRDLLEGIRYFADFVY